MTLYRKTYLKDAKIISKFWLISPYSGLLFHIMSLKISKNIKKGLKTHLKLNMLSVTLFKPLRQVKGQIYENWVDCRYQ